MLPENVSVASCKATEDALSIRNGAQYFSNLELTEGYHQLEFDMASGKTATFSTRLLFLVNTAAENLMMPSVKPFKMTASSTSAITFLCEVVH